MEWYEAVELIEPHIVTVSDQGSSGTGFLLARSVEAGVVEVATAAHVIKEAHDREQPITVEHYRSGKSLVLTPELRACFLDENNDTAALMFFSESLPSPVQPLNLIQTGKRMKVGEEVGWVGFPCIGTQRLCFFSGRVSGFRQGSSEDEYLIDGTAIHGVSGAPIFCMAKTDLVIIGVMTAYISQPNHKEIPGLALAANVTHLQELVKQLKSFDDAKKMEKEAASRRPAG